MIRFQKIQCLLIYSLVLIERLQFCLVNIIAKTYRKVPKFSDARKLCCNLPKIQTKSPNLRAFSQKDANGIANSEDPDQTAPLGSGSALFALTYMSENL